MIAAEEGTVPFVRHNFHTALLSVVAEVFSLTRTAVGDRPGEHWD